LVSESEDGVVDFSDRIADKSRILFIDDSAAQLQLYRRQLEGEYSLSLARSYEEAIAALTTNLPDLIVLDMVMPEVGGLEFLDILRFSLTFRDIPVIIVSGDNKADDIRLAFQKGAADYIRKPYDGEELALRIRRSIKDRKRATPDGSGPGESGGDVEALMIRSLADLAATRDNETGKHLVRMSKYVGAVTIAAAKNRRFADRVDADFIDSITSLAVLHDIGKVSIPDSILQKPGRLTPQEFEIMKTHTTKGAETIENVHKSFPRYAFLSFAGELILHHHERWDGTGYPYGLAGEAIPLQARIVAIADVFDALTMKRVYKEALPIPSALASMSAESGRQFDPRLLEIFLGSFKEIEAIHGRYTDET